MRVVEPSLLEFAHVDSGLGVLVDGHGLDVRRRCRGAVGLQRPPEGPRGEARTITQFFSAAKPGAKPSAKPKPPPPPKRKSPPTIRDFFAKKPKATVEEEAGRAAKAAKENERAMKEELMQAVKRAQAAAESAEQAAAAAAALAFLAPSTLSLAFFSASAFSFLDIFGAIGPQRGGEKKSGAARAAWRPRREASERERNREESCLADAGTRNGD